MQIAYTFDDVLIVPKYSNVNKRINSNPSTYVGGMSLDLPIFSSNMKTVTGPALAKEMINWGGQAVMHRFSPIQESVDDWWQVEDETGGQAFVSLGVNLSKTERSDEKRYHAFREQGAINFCIDVAHGHHSLVKEMVEFIKSNHSHGKLMAGNVATYDGASFLADLGVDIIKVGLGGGSACTTRKNTGVGIPQLYALEQCWKIKEQHPNVGIIGDGGIKAIGDIPKALKYSDAVMLGGMLAGCIESPGSTYHHEDGTPYKVYMGSASAQAKQNAGYTVEHVEGITKEIPATGITVQKTLCDMEEGIRSCFSYVGAKHIKEFRENAEFVFISEGARRESKLR